MFSQRFGVSSINKRRDSNTEALMMPNKILELKSSEKTLETGKQRHRINGFDMNNHRTHAQHIQI